MKTCIPIGAVVLMLAWPAAASGLNGINGSMPNRISMNVTVPRQTQGATFGEKVNAGLHAAGGALAQGAALKIDIGCGGTACVIAFPGGDGVRVDLEALRMTPLEGAGRQALPGGALPGGGIVSAAVSSLAGAGGGAAAASYAATGRTAAAAAQLGPAPLPARRISAGAIEVTRPLTEGDYLLVVVAERAGSGLKDTVKTQVRAAAPRVRVELAFSVEGGVLKARHDTAKNSVSNIR
ncbi:MAG: hypothetical protein ABS98_03680 [Lysobacteraceae bacterium SCN 69-48]|nr:MAG: hypothetical protein ABS98_03680 [Xanthomonadaceae bacterium SCN 69-48]